MKLRLLILLGPIILVVGLLLVLAAYHPSATGRLEIKDSAKLDVQTNGEPLHLDDGGLELITELVVRNVPVTITAEKISVQGQRNAFQQLILEPLAEFQLSHDLPPADKRKITFGLESPQNVKLSLAHRSDRQGFYCDFSAHGHSAFSIDYDSGGPDIVLVVKGVRIKDAGQNDTEVTSVAQDGLELRLSRSTDEVTMRFATTPQGASNFLSIRYKLPGGVYVPIFSEQESHRLQLEGRNYLSSAGTARLLLNGKLADEVGGVDVAVESAALKMPRGIKGSATGLSTELEGTFDFVGSAPVGTSSQAAANPARPPKFSPRLPSKLSQIESFYLILLGAIAYIIDKVVTIVKFLRPSTD